MFLKTALRSSWVMPAIALFIIVLGAPQVIAADPVAAVNDMLARLQREADPNQPYDSLAVPGGKALSLDIDGDGQTVRARLVMNDAFSNRPWSPEAAAQITGLIENALREAMAEGEAPLPGFTELEIIIGYGGGQNFSVPFSEFVTSAEAVREKNLRGGEGRPELAAPVVQPRSYVGPPRELGLQGRNIVVAASHGLTWHKDNRWQFQRARLFTTIEDMYPMSYINPFLIPMLENAGATVFSARERDFQTGETIVDNDEQPHEAKFEATGDWSEAGEGWRGGVRVLLDARDEPFKDGTSLKAETGSGAAATFTPHIPHAGRYAVYAAWSAAPENSRSVPYVIRHLGGETTVAVNQQVAGNLWIYLGHFNFASGSNAATGSVVVRADDALPNDGGGATTISIDAVRFGGGMGSVAPDGQLSHHPRYLEGARYWLQYAGGAANLMWNQFKDDGRFGIDYNRDILARAEWPNYLEGAPNGPTYERTHDGKNVPVDATIYWHTDAGIQKGIVGTLSIFKWKGQEGSINYPDGRPRALSRDLAAIVQNEISRQIRSSYTSTWPNRQLMERNFGETRRQNTPSMVLELLSHQNFNDMKYGNDPRFKRDVARAVYKAIARFVAWSNGYEPVIQPLAPTHVAAVHQGGGRVFMSWRAQEDPLEPTATPMGYIVYRSADGRGWDNGTPVPESTSVIFEDVPVRDTTYFKISAVNAGGESLPSRVVGVRWTDENNKKILIIDGYDRISGPALVDEPGAKGFDVKSDPGVGYHYHYGLVGAQYDFDPKSDWENDLETPGWGATTAEFQQRLMIGNTFDHIVAHGELAAAAGLQFDSALNDAFEIADASQLGGYALIDWIAGKQRTVMPPTGIEKEGKPDQMEPAFPVLTQAAIKNLTACLEANDGKLVISGAYVIEDLTAGPLANAATRAFVQKSLGISGYSSRATSINAVVAADEAPDELSLPGTFRFGHDLEPPINIEPTVYPVPSAESLTAGPGKNLKSFLKYGDTDETAGIIGKNGAVIGFPIESILPPAKREDLYKTIIDHLLD